MTFVRYFTFATSARQLARGHAFVLACVIPAAYAFAAGPVKAPPLPPGSALVKVKAGQNPEEEQRAARAHKHKAGKVDPTGDKHGSKS